MNGFFKESVFFGVALSLLAYAIGTFLNKKTKLAFVNPLLISIIITVAFLCITRIDYDVYYTGAKYLGYLLTPATVCFAVPLYEKLHLLKSNLKAIAAGIISGVLTSLLCVFVMSLLFKLEHSHYVTLLPKSVTTAIGIGISEELGGYPALTTAMIIVTGVLGNMTAVPILKLFKITKPVAKGIAIGSASHAMGTSRAMQIGKTEGAMSSLSIVISGLLTVVAASVFSYFI